MKRWFVCDMDLGVLRVHRSRSLAVAWSKKLLGQKVVGRHSYGPGRYEYTFGVSKQDATSAFIIREDRMSVAGFNPEQKLMYPLITSPFDEVPR